MYPEPPPKTKPRDIHAFLNTRQTFLPRAQKKPQATPPKQTPQKNTPQKNTPQKKAPSPRKKVLPGLKIQLVGGPQFKVFNFLLLFFS